MNRDLASRVVRAEAWLVLLAAPAMAALGIARSEPAWLCGAAMLVAYELAIVYLSHRPAAGRSSSDLA